MSTEQDNTRPHTFSLLSTKYPKAQNLLIRCRLVFAYRFNKNHTDLGFPRFVRRNILTDKKSGCLVGDKLTIEFSLQMIHNTLYARECTFSLFLFLVLSQNWRMKRQNFYYFEGDTTSFSWKLINVSSLNSRVTSTPFSLKDCKW